MIAKERFGLGIVGVSVNASALTRRSTTARRCRSGRLFRCFRWESQLPPEPPRPPLPPLPPETARAALVQHGQKSRPGGSTRKKGFSPPLPRIRQSAAKDGFPGLRVDADLYGRPVFSIAARGPPFRAIRGRPPPFAAGGWGLVRIKGGLELPP